MAQDRTPDPGFEADELENEDPLGEQAFAEGGFEDGPRGEPLFSAPGLEDETVGRRPGGHGQKVGGVPEDRQREPNTPSEQRPDSTMFVVRERGGESKGDPAVGGTRTD